MRHRKKVNHLGRTASHRKAMLSNMAVSLIKHKRINTTLAKAKALQVYVEPLITKSKEDTTHSRRVAFSYLQDKDAVSVLFREVSEKVADRPGGYTRILKTGYRLGDNAQMCFIELVDFNDNMLEDKSAKKSTRRRRSSKKSTTEAPAKTETVKAEVTEETLEEVKDEAVVVEEKTEVVEDVKEEASEEVKEEPVAETEETVEAKTEEKADDKADDKSEGKESK